jgi:hypothetical protein
VSEEKTLPEIKVTMASVKGFYSDSGKESGIALAITTSDGELKRHGFVARNLDKTPNELTHYEIAELIRECAEGFIIEWKKREGLA